VGRGVRASCPAAGFSIIEALVTIAIIGIVAGIALVAFGNVLPSVRADGALQLVEAQLRQAREVSVDQRRNVSVTFQGTNEMVTVRTNSDGSTTTLADYFLPYGMAFAVVTGVPDLPAPDNYGNAQAISFSTCASLPCSIFFFSDGSIGDPNGIALSGTVFISTGGKPATARAMAILGATGRIKGYRYSGTAWR
jgi:prepilin-type N-terminal cleavage/methylation domain-containing protein